MFGKGPPSQNQNAPHRSTSADERQALRRLILAARDAMPAMDRGRRSRIIFEHLWLLPEFARADLIFSYVAFRSEVETVPLIRRCLAAGKQVAVPLTRSRPPRLEAYRLLDVDRDLVPGYRGIPEPDPRRLPRVAPGELALVLLPGSVFDRQGGRLGYGGGYYDRFLSTAAPAALRIGLAFELQVVASVPLEPHDQRLDFLITEEGVTRISREPVAGMPKAE
jgi:5-formyltetrahydrofolate cyclo-ligase